MKTIIKKTIIFEFEEVYVLLKNNHAVVGIEGFDFTTERRESGKLEIVTKKKISEDVINTVVLDELKRIDENGDFVISIENHGIVCRNSSDGEVSLSDVDDEDVPLLKQSFDKFFNEKLKTSMASVRMLNGMLHFMRNNYTVEGMLNQINKPRNFGKQAAAEFSEILRISGIDHPEQYPFFKRF